MSKATMLNPVRRDQVLALRYGLPRGEYDRLQIQQDGRCAVCRKPPKQGRLQVDHDHDSGRVRGLVCGPCNLIIAWAKDDPSVLLAAADYLMT